MDLKTETRSSDKLPMMYVYFLSGTSGKSDTLLKLALFLDNYNALHMWYIKATDLKVKA